MIQMGFNETIQEIGATIEISADENRELSEQDKEYIVKLSQRALKECQWEYENS